MGCTSSAPNMTSPKLNTAEKSIQFEEYISDEQSSGGMEEIIYRADGNNRIEINELPSCDKVAERLPNIDRNKSTASMQSVTDQENHHPDRTHDDEKRSKLEEVVEKVVELYIENDDTPALNQKGEDIEMVDHGDENTNKREPAGDSGNRPNEETEEASTAVPEDALSPSQSESSRATRWEALADIAAELPASLAVDPLTGQIYALAK